MINVRHHAGTIALAAICIALAHFVFQPAVFAQTRAACLDDPLLSMPANELERTFDVQFDRNAEGSSFSCDIFVRAAEAHAALNRFRMGVLYESRDDLNASIRFPIKSGVLNTLEGGVPPIDIYKIEDADDFIDFKRREFSDALIALISCANTLNVMIVKSRTYGFAIGLGSIWFQPEFNVHPVKVTGINVYPVSEEIVLDRCSRHLLSFPEVN